MSDLLVSERFVSIQGESTQAGRGCYFIRLSHCNLQCSYCDTMHANGQGEAFSVEQLVADAVASGVQLVEITGGEPLLQDGCILLAEQLLAANLEVMIETNGSCDISKLPQAVRKIVDCKLPSSQMSEHNLFSNYAYLCKHDEIKFVIGDEADFHYARKVVEKYQLAQRCEVLYSPVWGKVEFTQLAQWVLEYNMSGRMQLQMHKLIWGAEATGV